MKTLSKKSWIFYLTDYTSLDNLNFLVPFRYLLAIHRSSSHLRSENMSENIRVSLIA